MIGAGRAREILATYRAATSDDTDPFYAEALELCRRDSDLARWLEQQCETDEKLRLKFGEIPVPLELEQRILGPTGPIGRTGHTGRTGRTRGAAPRTPRRPPPARQ